MIYVLLILAGISISMLAGDNSILQKATEAKTRTDEAQIKEALQLAITSAASDYYTEHKTGTLRDYIFSSDGQAKIRAELGTNDVTFDTTNYTITYKGIKFSIAEDGTVSSNQVVSADTGNTDNLQAEELPDDFWIASEGVAYINTKYIDMSASSYYGGSGSGSGSYSGSGSGSYSGSGSGSYSGSGSGSYSGSGSGSGAYGGTPAVQAGACQYTKIAVPSNINGETVTKFSVENVNNLILIEINEGINDIPSLSIIKDTLQQMKVPKKDITKDTLNGKLTDFGSEGTGYTISNSSDNKFWIVNIKDELQLAINESETESRAAIIKVTSTLGGSNRKKNVTLTCSNGENVTSKTSTQEDFIVTKNGNYTVTATLTDGKITSQTINVTKCKIEEYSGICASNTNLKAGTNGLEPASAGDTVVAVCPAGFAYGTSTNVGTVTKGLVITDSVEVVNGKNYSNGNEFVWIPITYTAASGSNAESIVVKNTSKPIATKTTGETENLPNYQGALYSEFLANSTPNSNYVQSNTNDYREPAVLAYDTGYYSSQGVTELIMQGEYNKMIQSVKKYGGFYVARYEMGKESDNFSKIAVTLTSAGTDDENSWYGLYTRAKSYNKSGVTAGMIWGSQYDAMLNFGLTNSTDSSKITANTNGNHSGKLLKTGTWLGTSNQTDKINNIFDLEGNLDEFTKEALATTDRVRRGGCFGTYGTQSPHYRVWSNPDSVDVYHGSRLSLYINV